MTVAMQLVLSVLRGDAKNETITASEDDWRAAIQWSEEERILPFFIAKLRDSGRTLSVAIQSSLEIAERDAARAGFWWTSELKGLLSAFGDAGLPVISLKGPMLAQRLCGSAALRPCRDLDILVKRSDFRAAASLLQELGFTAAAHPDDYHQPWHRGTTGVELHVDVENPRIFNFEIDSVWDRCRQGEFAGVSATILGPVDEYLFLCLHGARHQYDRLSHVLDVALALKQIPAAVLSDAIASRAAELPVMQLGFAMARRLSLSAESPQFQVAITADAVHIEKLADSLWAVLLDRSLTISLSQVPYSFYVKLESTPIRRIRRRCRHLRVLAIRLIDADFVFAARFGIHWPAMVWVLRQLRLVPRLLGFGRKPVQH